MDKVINNIMLIVKKIILVVFVIASAFISISSFASSSISHVAVSPTVFNSGDLVAFEFKVNTGQLNNVPQDISVSVYDARGYLVWSTNKVSLLTTGNYQAIWNGKSNKGQAVPPEVYYYVITLKDTHGSNVVYDLTDQTGGEPITVREIDYQSKTGLLTYTMPSHGRIFLRYGVKGGVMLGTIVNSAINQFGQYTLTLTDAHRNRIETFTEPETLQFSLNGYSLPNNALIRASEQHSLGPTQWQDLPADKLISRKPTVEKNNLNSQIYRFQNRETSKDFSIELTPKKITQTRSGSWLINDQSAVKIDIAEEDKLAVKSQRFEVSFYIDNKLVYENEVSYVPYTWYFPNDLNLAKGKHFLTARVLSFGNLFGVASRVLDIR